MAPFARLAVILLVGSCSGTNEAGERFLKANENLPGVITLPSGLQYRIISAGSGSENPGLRGNVEFNYAGTTLDMEPNALEIDVSKWDSFDSSWKRGKSMETTPEAAFVPAMTEMLQLMVEGDLCEVYAPSKLGYGDRDTGRIKAGSVLIYRIELLKISGDTVPVLKCDVQTLENCTKKQTEYITVMKKKARNDRLKEVERLEEAVMNGPDPELFSCASKMEEKQLFAEDKKKEQLFPEAKIRLLKKLDARFGSQDEL